MPTPEGKMTEQEEVEWLAERCFQMGVLKIGLQAPDYDYVGLAKQAFKASKDFHAVLVDERRLAPMEKNGKAAV